MAIQCLALTKFDVLESEDSNRFFNHVNVAHNHCDLTLLLVTELIILDF